MQTNINGDQTKSIAIFELNKCGLHLGPKIKTVTCFEFIAPFAIAINMCTSLTISLYLKPDYINYFTDANS